MSIAATDAVDLDPLPPVTRLWWIVPAAALLILLTLSMLLGRPPDRPVEQSSYAVTDAGYRALYLVLESLNLPVERTRRAGGSRGGPRWLLSPHTEKNNDIDELADWVRRGGQLLLATENEAFARQLGVPIRELTGRLGIEPVNAPQRTIGRLDDRPLVSIHGLGQGTVWLLHRPDILTNSHLRDADNAIQAVQLAEAMRAEQPGPIAFDEFFHGLRDRPGVTEILFRPPALPVTLQALALTLVVLWHFAPRFGVARSLPPPDRRSKEEFLDALAGLLERKGDFDDAFRTVQSDFVQRIESALGLPAGASVEQLATEAARRRGMRPEQLQRLLSSAGPPRDAGSRRQSFVAALHDLRVLDHEFFESRKRPR